MADLETRETDRHTGRTDTAKNRTNSTRSCNFSNWHFSAMIAVEHAAIKANRIMLLANAATAARNQQELTNNYGCPGGGIWIWTGCGPFLVGGFGCLGDRAVACYVQCHVNAQASRKRGSGLGHRTAARVSGKKLLGKGKSQKGFVYAKKFYKPLTKMLRLGICHIKFTQQQQKRRGALVATMKESEN